MADAKMLEGKVVVVTGAGRGIGAAIAKLAAQKGAKVIVNDIGVALDGAGGDQTPAQEIVNEIKKAGGEAAANYDSVAEFSSAGKIIQCAMDNFGRIDAVVNNAGILRDVIFHKMTENDWDSVVNVMLKGAFNTARHAADHFRKQESGAFVHMTSTSGLIGGMGQANYGAAKLGMVAAYPVVPLTQNQALSVGIISYDGGVYVGLYADRDAMVDIDVLAGCIEDAMDELLERSRSSVRSLRVVSDQEVISGEESAG